MMASHSVPALVSRQTINQSNRIRHENLFNLIAVAIDILIWTTGFIARGNYEFERGTKIFEDEREEEFQAEEYETSYLDSERCNQKTEQEIQNAESRSSRQVGQYHWSRRCDNTLR